jgi:multisubunit Na+/H+ antiporter MnhG subunit
MLFRTCGSAFFTCGSTFYTCEWQKRTRVIVIAMIAAACVAMLTNPWSE